MEDETVTSFLSVGTVPRHGIVLVEPCNSTSMRDAAINIHRTSSVRLHLKSGLLPYCAASLVRLSD